MRSRSEKMSRRKVEVEGVATRKESVEFGYSGSDGEGREMGKRGVSGVNSDGILSFKGK